MLREPRLINRRITDIQSLQHLDLRFRAQSDIRARSGGKSGRDHLDLKGNVGPPNSTPCLRARQACRGGTLDVDWGAVNVGFFSCSCPDTTLINRGPNICKSLNRLSLIA